MIVATTRIQLQRIVPAAILAVLAAVILTMPVGAGVSWCRADPIVELGDTKYQVFVAVPEHNVPQVVGSLDFTFASPKGTDQEVLFLDSGFNGHGETVTFMTYDPRSRDSRGHMMSLSFKYTGAAFPIMVEVYKNGKLATVVEGTSSGMKIALP